MELTFEYRLFLRGAGLGKIKIMNYDLSLDVTFYDKYAVG